MLHRGENAPQPEARRRGGETDKASGPAARRRYDRLRETHRDVAREQRRSETGKAFGAAAKAAVQLVVRLPADIYEGAAAADMLDWMNMWEANGMDDDGDDLDEDFDTNQDHNFPQP